MNTGKWDLEKNGLGNGIGTPPSPSGPSLNDYNVTIFQTKHIEKYYPMVFFIILWQMVVAFESSDLWMKYSVLSIQMKFVKD